MHVPDGFLDAQTSVTTGAVALVGLSVALRRARTEQDDRTTPLAGLVAAFIFATQMVNFPVGAGTSGHLLGGALAAVLVGPWTGVLCMSTVLLVQSFLFADGGITALGTNITLMGLVGVGVGWFFFRLAQRLLPKNLRSVSLAAGIGGLVSVPTAALAFTGLYAVGGTVSIPIGNLAAAMIGWHSLIGIGEAAITSMTISAVVGVRPDLVFGAQTVLEERALQLRGQDDSEAAA